MGQVAMQNDPKSISTVPRPDMELVHALEQHSACAWPAPEVVFLNGWELRFAPGSHSRRVNALTPVAPISGQFPPTLALSQKLCRERGLPCTVRLTPAADDQTLRWLEEKGFVNTDQTSVQISPIGTSHGMDEAVVLIEGADASWTAAMCAASDTGLEEAAVINRILASVAMPQVLASVVENGEPVCFGRAVAGNGLLGIFQIVTRADARRRGLARRLVPSLMNWGRRHAAMRAYLQVVSDNKPARSLYEKIGFREVYTYSYSTSPNG
jgi:ribosomal protein S18 acetylase RimI-like enzyme